MSAQLDESFVERLTMSACEQQVFSGVGSAQFARVIEKARVQGIDIPGNTGSASSNGVTIAWSYDADSGNLTVQCTDAPFFIGCDAINSAIRNFVGDCAR